MITRNRAWGGDLLRVENDVDVYEDIPEGAEEAEDFDEGDYFHIETEVKRFLVAEVPDSREGYYSSQDGQSS